MIRAVLADGLLDPAAGEVTREAAVIIENGRVTHAGPRSTVPVPRDAETTDAAGLTREDLKLLSAPANVHLVVKGGDVVKSLN